MVLNGDCTDLDEPILSPEAPPGTAVTFTSPMALSSLDAPGPSVANLAVSADVGSVATVASIGITRHVNVSAKRGVEGIWHRQ